ncbi:30S ribosomal protein S11 [Patescibacteria group bacterium]|nr:30S ribosomal protein S11 [Patescibacteria group bacterium]
MADEQSTKEQELTKEVAQDSTNLATAGVVAELPDDVKKKLEKAKAARLTAVKGKRRRKAERTLVQGNVYIKSTYNNTIVTITDENGDAVSWASAGLAGFRGPKKSTPYAAQVITKIAVDRAKEMGLTDVHVFVKGVAAGREAAIRALNANGLVVNSIKDVTPIPHNGCRPRKPRRV